MAPPELTGLLSRLDLLAVAYQRGAVDLAEQIGELLVPHASLTARQRGDALRARRALHSGAVLSPVQFAGLAALAGRALGDLGTLAGQIRALMAAAADLVTAQGAAQRAVAHEDARLLALPWQVLHDSPAGVCALRGGDLAIYGDIAARIAAGEPWTTKRMRHRSGYLWRMLARAATKPTPRGWLAHVTPIEVHQTGGWSGDGHLLLRDRAAVEVADNLGWCRDQASTAADLSGAEVTLAVSALSRLEAAHLTGWAFDGEDRTKLTAVRVRRTPVLDAVLAALADRPQPAGQLLADLAGPDDERRQAMRGFLTHLLALRLIEAGLPPRSTHSGWRPTGHFRSAAPARARAASPDPFVDVYRAPAGGISASHARRLADLVALALRVIALADHGAAVAGPAAPAGLADEPRPVLEIAADCIRTGAVVGRARQHRHDWPPVTNPDSPYGRLVRWLGEQLDNPAAADVSAADVSAADVRAVDISAAVLDRVGGEAPAVDWPLDCLLRPIRAGEGLLAVLDQAAPAGLLDARFVPGLRHIGSPVPQADAYRRFLASRGDTAGIPFVEILVPPLTQRAANAVRRPAYTSMWTGDPDLAGYFLAGDATPATYLPLSQITLRRRGGAVIAEAGGRQIWPVLHTARNSAPPWDTIASLLLLASPQPERRWWRTISYSLPGWPQRDFMPPISVGGGLVISPAQWRLPVDGLWRPRDSMVGKATALLRLRRRLGMPRWVAVAADVHDEARVVDLDSLHALRSLDRLSSQGTSALLVAEFQPALGQLPVHDEAAGAPVVAELLLRLFPAAGAGTVSSVPAGQALSASGDPAGRTAGPTGTCDRPDHPTRGDPCTMPRPSPWPPATSMR